MKEEEEKKRGRREKKSNEKYRINKEQVKFFVDLGKEKKELEKVFKILEQANKKEMGREITFKDLALFSINKIGQKDIERMQEMSLTEMEKVERALQEYNNKNNTKLALGEFLVKKLSI